MLPIDNVRMSTHFRIFISNSAISPAPQYIANKILKLNERGWYKDPAVLKSSTNPADAAQLGKQDEEIFQTARLVNCMWFAQVVFSDYFATILGLVRDGSSWNLNPFGVSFVFLIGVERDT